MFSFEIILVIYDCIPFGPTQQTRHSMLYFRQRREAKNKRRKFFSFRNICCYVKLNGSSSVVFAFVLALISTILIEYCSLFFLYLNILSSAVAAAAAVAVIIPNRVVTNSKLIIHRVL